MTYIKSDRQIIQDHEASIKALRERLADLALIMQEVDKMRKTQRDYFRSGASKVALRIAKASEQRVDTFIARLKQERFIEDPSDQRPPTQKDLFR